MGDLGPVNVSLEEIPANIREIIAGLSIEDTYQKWVIRKNEFPNLESIDIHYSNAHKKLYLKLEGNIELDSLYVYVPEGGSYEIQITDKLHTEYTEYLTINQYLKDYIENQSKIEFDTLYIE